MGSPGVGMDEAGDCVLPDTSVSTGEDAVEVPCAVDEGILWKDLADSPATPPKPLTMATPGSIRRKARASTGTEAFEGRRGNRLGSVRHREVSMDFTIIRIHKRTLSPNGPPQTSGLEPRSGKGLTKGCKGGSRRPGQLRALAYLRIAGSHAWALASTISRVCLPRFRVCAFPLFHRHLRRRPIRDVLRILDGAGSAGRATLPQE